MADLYNPHDKYFKESMSDLRIAKDFFAYHLPQRILQEIDLGSLSLCKESLLDEHLQLLLTDILYQVDLNNGSGFVYLLVEHQSTPNRFMPLRIMQYICRIMKFHVEKLHHASLPVVIPIVLYHGKSPYHHSTDIMTLFGKQATLAGEYFLKPFELVDLSEQEDEDIVSRGWVGLMEYVQKYISHPDSIRHLRNVFPRFAQLKVEGEDRIIMATVKYIVEAAKADTPKQFLEILAKFQINNKGGDEMAQTLAEYWAEEGRVKGVEQGHSQGLTKGLTQGLHQGRNEGRAEGVQETTLSVVKNLAKEGLDPSLIARATNLPINKVKALWGEHYMEVTD